MWITGGERTSGTLPDVVLMVIYGDNGKSDELKLTNGQLCKDQLASDRFKVKLLMHSVDLASASALYWINEMIVILMLMLPI